MQSLVLVADFFADELVGGAELTTQSLVDSSPFNLIKLRSSEVTMQKLQELQSLHWIFGNWAGVDKNLIPSVIANLSYSVLEYDYKFCKYRSPEKHALAEGGACECEKSPLGSLVGAFYYGARSLWWMSERQQRRYHDRFPFLSDRNQIVLSSVFGEDFWVNLKRLKEANNGIARNGWLVLGSSSWVKGTEDAIKWCEDNGKEYEILQGLSPVEVLEKMSKAEGFVYLPRGGDTCPRVVIEAKLLGCQLHLNENVEHKDEIWFTSPDTLETESYLYSARETFWNGIRAAMEWRPTVSGYTTTKDCISQGYPWERTVESMLGFCDEVVVVDGGSTDGTWERLTQLASENEKLVVRQVKRDWSHKRFAVFDGDQKAEARKLCTKEFCWQMDADEVLPPQDWPKVHDICRRLTPEIDLVSLPVVEYWGSKDRVRIDVTPWKWRLSRNKPYITHGIPKFLRMHDREGNLYAKQGTDGCDYVHAVTGELIPHASFYTEQAHHARSYAVAGDKDALRDYGQWFTANVNGLPSVRHYSWIDIERKIKTYKGYWQRHWESLYDVKQEDTAENNMFFDKPWCEVTDTEIRELAHRLSTETGGHVFHSKVDWSRPTPYLSIAE